MRSVKLNKLTQLEVKNAPAKGVLSDGGGLYLRNGLWVFRYTSPVTEGERDLSIGPRHSVTLKAARERATEYRGLLAENIDPHYHVAEKLEAKKAEAAKAITFGPVAARWIEAKLGDRKSPKNQRAIRSIITTHLKALANVPIASVKSAIIADAVKPLKDRPAQRDNVVSLVHSIFDWAMAADLIPETLNPARRKKLGTLLPKRDLEARPIRHNRFGKVKELPAFIVRLSATDGNLARCLEFVVHTGLRQNEAVNLRWAWVDLTDKSITIPGTAMKAKKDHTIYLADRPFAIVMGMLPQRREGGLVFPGGSESGGIGLRSMRNFLRERFPDLGQVQLHGARASLKSWTTANTTHRRELIELALAHRGGDAVEMAYLDINELRKAREALYRDWSNFLTSGASAEDAPNVVPLKTTATV
jgi:integrase